ncbi:MAG: TonB-dependent receptor, partial [Calditrichaeota bacterium]|nr:TonB-dependent receptor [Calditrichota bacterium]
PLVRDSYEERNLLVKLTSDLSNNMKLTISGLYNSVDAVGNNDVGQPGVFRSAGSVADVLTQAGFTINSRIFYDSYWPLSDVDRYNISAKFTHALSSNTFYEAKLERVHTKYHTRPNAQRDTTKVYDVGVGFLVDEAPYGNEERLVFGVDGMLMGVRANARDFSELSTTTLKFDFTSQVNNTNLIKTGIEVVHNNYNMEFGAINDVLPTQRPWTDWERSPLRAALYLQDKLEFKGLIANAGLRLDYIDPRGTWWNFGDDPYNQAFFSTDFDPGEEVNFDQVSVDKQLTISPRLGISHPITINSKLFFNYGHFRQMPISDRLYNVRRTFQDQLSLIGDPNLPLQKTVAYELGYEHS